MHNNNIISSEATLLEAIEWLNRLSGTVMTLFLVDEKKRLRATLTDGDVRRGLLAGIELTDSAIKAGNRKFKALRGPIDDSSVAELQRLRQCDIDVVPRLDSEGRIIEIINLRETLTRLPVRALLMAGGSGERLRPLTLKVPKPLLEIDGKPIIDYNIEALETVGITDISVAVRYLAEKIEAHFADTPVRCLREDKPLGTIGAAALLPKLDEGSTLVMNSDLITSISFEGMFLKHTDDEADITIAVVPYQVAVPFAILELDGDNVIGLKEKPVYSYYANAGIYMIRNKLLADIEPGMRVDATDLVEKAIAKGCRVSYFPIKGLWMDVGTPADFRQASELMRRHRELKGE